jgi:hypothetical protein
MLKIKKEDWRKIFGENREDLELAVRLRIMGKLRVTQSW